MAKIRIAFYRARWNKPTDFIIAGWTWFFNPFTSPYSHVEIGFELAGQWNYFSSSFRDRGTRWKGAKELFKHPKRWDVFESEYNHHTTAMQRDRANRELKKKYDWLGILGFITLSGQIFNFRGKWYCSEVCWYVMTGYWRKRISPRRMSKIIKTMEFEKVEV